MGWSSILLLLSFCTGQILAQAPAPSTQSADLPLHRQIDRSIGSGVKYLLSTQQEDGGWENDREENRIGAAALAGLALLNAGESHQSPALVKVIAFLKASKPESTYCVALRAAFYAQLPEPLRKIELPADFRWLREALIENGDNKGLYTYTADTGRRTWADLSNSQYGVLGVWYAALAGLEVPTAYWRAVEAAWLKAQNEDGGWGYTIGDDRSYGSMTAAGAATLFITQDYIHARRQFDLSRPITNAPLDRAIVWLGKHYAVDHNPGRDRPLNRDDDGFFGFGREAQTVGWLHYMLFAYERVGEASGLTYFGKTRWFERGARQLILTQRADGSWRSRAGSVCDTAYSLLFLSRGRAPVGMQKLQAGDRWNNRSRDAAGAVRWLAKQSERHVNWQVLSVDARLSEYRESPVLYVASDVALELREDQKRKLKAFIDQGGLLVAANDGHSKALCESIESLARQWYPQYAFRELLPDHILFQQNFTLKNWVFPIRGLSNGVRELIILLPAGDVSWKLQLGPGTKDISRAPVFALFANFSLYATERANARFKGDDWWVDAPESAAVLPELTVARLKHSGNWNPEPAGWERMSNLLQSDGVMKLSTTVVDASGLSTRIPLAHLTTTGEVQLDPASLALLRRYLREGGTLLIDAAGGSPEAAVAVENLAVQISEQPPGKLLPPGHPIYLADADELKQVKYRRFGQDRLPGQAVPRLYGIEINGRLAMIYTPVDLSAALVGYARDGITGYTPESATQLMKKILLWKMR